MTPRPLSWPTRPRLVTGCYGALRVALVFFPIYAGCAWLNGLRGDSWHAYAPWELALPFVPWMVLPYLSMFVLFLLPPWQLDEAELDALAARLIVASLLGGLVLLAFPTRIGFAPHADAGVWQAFYDGIYRLDGPANAVPSFHVIYTASILLAMRAAATAALRRAYMAWLALVCASTVLIHRHHLLDVVGGLALAFAVRPLPAWRGALDSLRLLAHTRRLPS